MSASLKYTALVAGALLAGSLASALPANATVLDFNSVTTGSTDAAGVWYTDRYAPAGFSSVPFDGDNRLALTVSSSDYQSNLFYDTQGRAYDLDAGTQYLSVQLYVTQAMIDSPNRITGLWGQAADPNNTPVIELANGNFRGWDEVNGVWSSSVAVSAADRWYTLSIYHDTGAGLFDYYIDGALFGSVGDSGAVDLVHAILQGENGLLPGPSSSTGDGTGTNGTYYYDNLTYAPVAATPLPATLPLFLTGAGVMGLVARKRRKNRAAAAAA